MGQKAESTKELIRREAYRLFADKGFQAVTMADICRQTGLSRGGLYRYYANTGQILSEILSAEPSVMDRIQRRESAAAILEDLLSLLREEILDKKNSLSLAIYEYANLGNQELFVSLHRRAKQRWIRLIQYGVETGEFQPADPEQVSDMILYYYQGLRLWSRVIPFDEQTVQRYIQTVRLLAGRGQGEDLR